MKEFEQPKFEIGKADVTNTSGRFTISPLEQGYNNNVNKKQNFERWYLLWLTRLQREKLLE